MTQEDICTKFKDEGTGERSRGERIITRLRTGHRGLNQKIKLNVTVTETVTNVLIECNIYSEQIRELISGLKNKREISL